MTNRMKEEARLELIVHMAQETKAEDLRLFDMENRSSITDFVFICSGRSQAHVRGIADKIVEEMKNAGHTCHFMEGHQEGSWILMDFDVVLVHVFHPETRAYYNLEELLAGFPGKRYDEQGNVEIIAAVTPQPQTGAVETA